jgi:hypothetical protein
MFIYNEPTSQCFECQEKENHLSDVKYWFRAVLDQLFGLEEFSRENLEHYTQELACYLNMKIPSQPLAVAEKKEVSKLMEEWKQFNNEYLKKLEKTGS